MSALERTDRIIASYVNKNRLFFCKRENERFWFGTQIIGRADTIQLLLPEQIDDFDRYLIWKKPPGTYTYGPYRYVVTEQLFAVDAPTKGYRYIQALSKPDMMKLLFFANTIKELGI